MPRHIRDRKSDRVAFIGAYDIRGRFPSDIGPFEINHLAAAFARLGTGPILVGRDVRKASAKVERLLVRGLCARGRSVISLGVQPTPAIGFAAAHFHCPALALTPSHNPLGYVGIKGFSSSGREYSREWEKIRRLYRQSVRSSRLAVLSRKRPPPHLRRSILDQGWIDSYLDHVTRHLSSSLSIVVDARGGAVAEVAPRALRKMGARVKAIHSRFSSNFYGLSPEPTSENIRALTQAVRAERADFGVTFDGDGDRAAFVDGRGRWTEPEVIATLLYRFLSPPGQPLVATVDASYRCEEILPTVRSRIGARYVEATMQRSGAVVGFEGSGHYYLREWGPSSDGILVSCILANLLERNGKSLSDLADEFGPIYRENRTIDFNSRAEAVRAYDSIRRHFSGNGVHRTVDGLAVQSPSGTMLVRVSNTQPALRVRLESTNRRRVRELGLEFDAAIKHL
jgi:phosphomannomutase / phosphoglucomutase